MEPFTMGILCGVATGILKERLHRATDKNLGIGETLSFMARGFTREVEGAYHWIRGTQTEDREQVLTIGIPAGKTKEEAYKEIDTKVRKHLGIKDTELTGTVKKPRRRRTTRKAPANGGQGRKKNGGKKRAAKTAAA